MEKGLKNAETWENIQLYISYQLGGVIGVLIGRFHHDCYFYVVTIKIARTLIVQGQEGSAILVETY